MREARDWLVRECFGEATPLLRSAAQIRNKDLRPWQPSSKVAIVGYDLPVNGSGHTGGGSGGQGGRGGGGGITKDTCMKMVMPEVQYSRLLLRSQMIRYRQAHPHPSPH